MALTATQVDQFRKKFTARQRELATLIKRYSVPEPPENGDGCDAASRHERECQRQTLSGGYNSENDQITLALARIAKEKFGICESCGDEIPLGRLEVFPTAKYCVRHTRR